MLRKRAHTAGELAGVFDLAKPTLSGHFNVLREAGLVTVERNGTTLTYRLNMSVAEELAENLLGLLNIDEDVVRHTAPHKLKEEKS